MSVFSVVGRVLNRFLVIFNTTYRHYMDCRQQVLFPWIHWEQHRYPNEQDTCPKWQ
ncbi:MAG: hypothetical protein LBT04_02315 [Prevotellaceae bacterium]|nr:hypothetical protein [Prevotellaceae bacterium]